MRKSLLALMILSVFVAGLALAQDKKPAKEAAEEAKPKFQYVGVKRCKMCHKSAKSGNQYGIWMEGPHAGAYETLANEESAAIAKEMGLKTPAQEAPECLSCHATAYGLKDSDIKGKITLEEGVSCESCHGPGSAYKKMSVMKNHEKSLEAGLWVITEETCTRCHNKKSPTYKEFDFAKKVKMVAHPTPEEEAAEEKGE